MADLPRLRPHAHGGKAYYDELKAILAEIGPALKADAEAICAAENGITVANLCRLALKYELNCKATCEALEDWHIVPCGVYDRLRERGLKPMAALKEIHDMQVSNTLAVLCALCRAAEKITEHEEDGMGACRYCESESYGVTEDGTRAGANDEAVEYHIDHEEWCPSFILDHAYADLDQAVVYRVLTDARAARD